MLECTLGLRWKSLCWKAGVLNDTGVDCEMYYHVAFWEANEGQGGTGGAFSGKLGK